MNPVCSCGEIMTSRQLIDLIPESDNNSRRARRVFAAIRAGLSWIWWCTSCYQMLPSRPLRPV